MESLTARAVTIRFVTALILATGTLSFPSALTAEQQFDYVTGEFWAELEPMIPQGGDYPLSQDDAIRTVLEEARYVFSGMIYGFRYRYTPSDRARQVNEVFELKPVAQIAEGDPRLRVMSTRREEKRIWIRFRYMLDSAQASWLSAWQSNTISTASGAGEKELWEGPPNKILAIEAAVKQAIRDYLRTQTRNKPRESTGKVLLDDVPRIIMDSGAYHATVTVKVRVDRIVPYQVF